MQNHVRQYSMLFDIIFPLLEFIVNTGQALTIGNPEESMFFCRAVPRKFFGKMMKSYCNDRRNMV